MGLKQGGQSLQLRGCLDACVEVQNLDPGLFQTKAILFCTIVLRTYA